MSKTCDQAYRFCLAFFSGWLYTLILVVCVLIQVMMVSTESDPPTATPDPSKDSADYVKRTRRFLISQYLNNAATYMTRDDFARASRLLELSRGKTFADLKRYKAVIMASQGDTDKIIAILANPDIPPCKLVPGSLKSKIATEVPPDRAQQIAFPLYNICLMAQAMTNVDDATLSRIEKMAAVLEDKVNGSELGEALKKIDPQQIQQALISLGGHMGSSVGSGSSGSGSSGKTDLNGMLTSMGTIFQQNPQLVSDMTNMVVQTLLPSMAPGNDAQGLGINLGSLVSQLLPVMTSDDPMPIPGLASASASAPAPSASTSVAPASAPPASSGSFIDRFAQISGDVVL